jgi:hypothetical protein
MLTSIDDFVMWVCEPDNIKISRMTKIRTAIIPAFIIELISFIHFKYLSKC